MEIPLYQVDAFTSTPFGGNPAAVCPLETWPDEHLLQAVAMENNLSETAFFVYEQDAYRIRWFTPAAEVELCGHATLASAHVLFNELGYPGDTVIFSSMSGPLVVQRERDRLAMDFPSLPPVRAEAPGVLLEALGGKPREVLVSMDYIAVYETEREIRELAPRMDLLCRLDLRGVAVTAPGTSCDFVSRFFAPGLGVPEDPVTGSAHCELTPYWSKRLGKRTLCAQQVSKRGGELICEDNGSRVRILGKAVTFLRGRVILP